MALTTVAVGLFFVFGGLYVIRNPLLRGARDLNLVTADGPVPGERGVAYVIGAVLLLVGLGFTYLGLAY
ncbi:hypothetical protein [Halobaculum marinum]|uniref:DUF3784 domain-containing protein n=1 Tax=Halobaculum marinum TaxID=3031996 RepID=A0ABD5WXG8_9EURY|nr:hypothetical protein [Halobaculum sp. DT55]